MLAAFVLYCVTAIRGTVVVWGGPDVVSAELTNNVKDKALTRIPGGVIVGLPELEGTIRMRCKNGMVVQGGYVTRSLHSWLNLSDLCRAPTN